MRTSASPMIVLRRCPTCSGFATFGPLRSITNVRGFAADATPSFGSVPMPRTASARKSDFRRRLMNPGPATVGVSSTSFGGRAATMAFATSGGFWPAARFAIAIAMFAW